MNPATTNNKAQRKGIVNPCMFVSFLLLLIHSGINLKAQSGTPPSWANKVVWYQIMVERFYNGDITNDPTPLTIRTDTSYKVPPDWKLSNWNDNWYALADWEKNYIESRHKNFTDILQIRRYGGDLQGVLDKLDYLSELGITAIYLNPVNDSPSLHKYDARNYHHIDVNFGPDPAGDMNLISKENPADPKSWNWTSADKLFLQLIREVHKRGMRIIIDYSWNHTGTEFWAWRDLVAHQEDSQFRDWYQIENFDNPETPINEFRYKGWSFVKSMPEIKKVDVVAPRISGLPYEGNINPGAKKHIFDVSRRWLSPNGDPSEGVDGFRLDVADQIPMGFWRDYRSFVKSINPEAYLVGEIWWEKWPDGFMNPVPYVKGDVFDAVMFYQLYRPARSFFANTTQPIDAGQFKDSLMFQWARLSEATAAGMMNVASTHDSPRLLTCFFNPGKYKFRAKPADDSKYKTGKPDAETYERVRLYLIHQFTNIGAPQIWNGEEMGMWGSDDPDCRKPLWWKEYLFKPESRNNYQPGTTDYDPVGFNQEQFDFYKKLIQIREENPALYSGKLKFFISHDKMLAYKRYNESEVIFILFNLDNIAHSFELPASGKYYELLKLEKFSGDKLTLKPLSAVILKKLEE
jgi:cyclomaltodextrinase / maltogenic alpha-amylase / neopullulanase